MNKVMIPEGVEGFSLAQEEGQHFVFLASAEDGNYVIVCANSDGFVLMRYAVRRSGSASVTQSLELSSDDFSEVFGRMLDLDAKVSERGSKHA